jgi:hypothetical protein
MPTLGVLLLPRKRDRVLSPELLAALDAGGVRVAPLCARGQPTACGACGTHGESAWAACDAILHKLPTDPGAAGPRSSHHQGRRPRTGHESPAQPWPELAAPLTRVCVRKGECHQPARSLPMSTHHAGAQHCPAPDSLRLPGLLDRLDAFAAAQPSVALIDPPAAVRRAARRDAMLAPLQGAPGGGWLLRPLPPAPAGGSAAPGPGPAGLQAGPQTAEAVERTGAARETQVVFVAAPPQVIVGAATAAAAEVLDAMRSAGVGFPCLVKPLDTSPAARGPAAAGRQAPAMAEANHAMGLLLGQGGLAALLAGALPQLAPPVVLQQYVPHGVSILKVGWWACPWLLGAIRYASVDCGPSSTVLPRSRYSIVLWALWDAPSPPLAGHLSIFAPHPPTAWTLHTALSLA